MKIGDTLQMIDYMKDLDVDKQFTLEVTDIDGKKFTIRRVS